MARSSPAIVAALLLAGALGCAADTRATQPRLRGAGADSPHRGGTLRFSFTDDVRTLDPAFGFEEFTLCAEHMLFDTLLDFAPAGAPDPLALVPGLAESWSVSPDGLVYSFRIREAAEFSDGEPVLAEDFVYALDRLLSPELGSPGAGFFTVIEGAQERLDGKAGQVAGLRALGPRQLEIRLARPEPSFAPRLAMIFATPLKRSHVERVGAGIREQPLGTGPFVLTGWRQGEWMTLARNPRYWNSELPYLDGVRIQLFVPREVAVLQFLRGDLETVDRMNPDDYLRFAQSPDWQPFLSRVPVLQVIGEVMNVTRKPFDDVRVRQAMNYAIDSAHLVTLNNGRVTAAHGVLPPLMPGYDPELPDYPHDPERARRLLAEAGYPHGFDVTYTALNDQQWQLQGQSIQADLAEVGIRMKPVYLSFSAYARAAGSGELDFFMTAWTMDFPDPWDFLDVLFNSKMITPENSLNAARHSNPRVDALLDAARVELDRGRRLAMYRQAERIIHDDCPWVFEFHPLWIEIRQPYVMNYRPHPVWLRDFRETWLDEPVHEVESP